MSAYVLSTAAQARKSWHQLQIGSKQITKEQIVNALMPHKVEIITRVHPKGGYMFRIRFVGAPREISVQQHVRVLN
jgi:hypothetical protein